MCCNCRLRNGRLFQYTQHLTLLLHVHTLHHITSHYITPSPHPPGPSSESRGLSEKELVLLTHGDSVASDNVAGDLSVVASMGGVVVGLAHRSKPIFGVQFHPETNLTPQGPRILENFLLKVACSLSVTGCSVCVCVCVRARYLNVLYL